MTSLSAVIIISCMIAMQRCYLFRRYHFRTHADRIHPDLSADAKTFRANHPFKYRRINNPELRRLHKSYNIELAILYISLLFLLLPMLAYFRV